LKKYRIKKISKLSVTALDTTIGMNHAENHIICEILANVMLCSMYFITTNPRYRCHANIHETHTKCT